MILGLVLRVCSTMKFVYTDLNVSLSGVFIMADVQKSKTVACNVAKCILPLILYKEINLLF